MATTTTQRTWDAWKDRARGAWPRVSPDRESWTELGFRTPVPFAPNIARSAARAQIGGETVDSDEMKQTASHDRSVPETEDLEVGSRV